MSGDGAASLSPSLSAGDLHHSLPDLPRLKVAFLLIYSTPRRFAIAACTSWMAFSTVSGSSR